MESSVAFPEWFSIATYAYNPLPTSLLRVKFSNSCLDRSYLLPVNLTQATEDGNWYKLKLFEKFSSFYYKRVPFEDVFEAFISSSLFFNC
jgi:hypothetical protein